MYVAEGVFERSHARFDVIRRDLGDAAPRGALGLNIFLPARELREALVHLLIGDDVLGRVAIDLEIGIGLDILAHLFALRRVGEVAAAAQLGAVLLVERFEQIFEAPDRLRVLAADVLNPRGARRLIMSSTMRLGHGPYARVAGNPVLGVPHRLEDRHHLVVIALQERVELVIVAARALHRHSEQSLERRLHSPSAARRNTCRLRRWSGCR